MGTMNKRVFKIISLTLSISLLISSIFSTYVFATDNFGANDINYNISETLMFSEDTVLVALTNQVSLRFNEYTAEDFKEVGCASVKDLSVLSGTKIKQAVNNISRSATDKVELEPYSGVAFSEYNQVLSLKISNPGKENVLKAIEILNKRDDVLYAEPNYMFEAAVSASTDSYFSGGQGRSIANLLHLQEAWNITTGSNNVMVGILDSGIDINNQDLEYNVDEAKSRSFYDNSNSCVDNYGHGTFIAGIIGARWNNGYSIAGVCENVSLVSLKVTKYVGGRLYADVEAAKLAIEYAQDRNIPVLNFSYGKYGDLDYSQTMRSAISSYNGLFVTSAGNDSKNTDIYTYGLGSDMNVYDNNIITVASCSAYGVASDFTNYGKTTVDVFAPVLVAGGDTTTEEEYTFQKMIRLGRLPMLII
jgi:subtilisin family serine protease